MHGTKPHFAALAVLLVLLPPAHAGVLKKAWQCTKATVNVQIALGKTLYDKSEKIAEIGETAGPCMAEAGADPQGFALIAGVITAVKIASPSSMPSGQCYSAVRGALAKPIALGLSAVIPSGDISAGLVKAANDPKVGDALWDQMTNMGPPLSTLTGHVKCACTILDGGADLLDVSEVTTAISDVSSSCAGFLDSAGLGFINTYGGKTIRWTKSEYSSISGKWDQLMGESNPAPDEVVYQRFYGSMVAPMAAVIATKGGFVGSLRVDPPYYSSNYNGGTGCYQNPDACRVDMAKMLDNCVAYYDSHTMSKSSALEVCNKWQARYPGEVAQLVKEHKGATAFLIVAQNVKQRMFADYGWRLPEHYPVKLDGTGSDMSHPYPWTKQQVDWLFHTVPGTVSVPDTNEPWHFTGTGLYASAPRLLPIVGFNGPLAYDLAYAGLRPQIRALIMKEWSTNGDVRLKYLAKMFPSQGAFSGAYGCPSGGPLTDMCMKYVQNGFDAFCRWPLGAVWADSKDILSLAFGEGGALENCRARLTPIIQAANDLTNLTEPLSNAQKACQAEPRSPSQTQCLTSWSALWDSCRQKSLLPPYTTAKTYALACLAQGNFKVFKLAPSAPPPNDGTPGGRPSAPLQRPAPATAPVGTAPPATPVRPLFTPVRPITPTTPVTPPKPKDDKTKDSDGTKKPMTPIRIGG